MTADTAPAWDGRPENPDVDGWHWLSSWTGLEGWEKRMPCTAKWHAGRQKWMDMEPDAECSCGEMIDWPPEHMARWHRYLAPALTPAEVSARERAAYAAGAEAMREAAATCALVNTACPGQRNAKDQWRESIGDGVAAAIRALPIPTDAAAALAEVVRREVEREREAIMQIVEQRESEWMRCNDEACGYYETECGAIIDAIRARSGEPTP